MASEPELEVRFFLSERDAQPLTAPLGSSGKIKYTCVALSANYIALGANTGGVYCFRRDYRYIQLLANKEGPVTLVRFSPEEQFLAVVAGGGSLVLWELRLSNSGVCKRVHVSGLLREAVIRDAVWEGRRGRVYFGDSQGRVAVASLPKSTMAYGLFRRTNEIIFQDKSPVVQLDIHGDMLLVSTHSRAVLLRLSSANRAGLQVGKKARDGTFGACFDVREREQLPVVYSARPGGRLWEASAEGDVQATVKMRELFTSPPTPILGHGVDPVFPTSTVSPSPVPSLPLSYLHSLHNGKHLVCYDNDGLYLWQPSSWQLTTWTTDTCGIVAIACEAVRREEGEDEGREEEGDGGITVCILVEEGRKVLVVTMATLLGCTKYLLQQKLLDQVTKLVCAHARGIKALLRSHPHLHSSLLTVVQHSLTNSHLLPPPLEGLQTVLKQMISGQVEETILPVEVSEPQSIDHEELERGEEGREEEEREDEGREEEEREEEGREEEGREEEGREEEGREEEEREEEGREETVGQTIIAVSMDSVADKGIQLMSCVIGRSLSQDDSDVISRSVRRHRRSNSWSGVPETVMSAAVEVEEEEEADGLLFQSDDLWSASGSHTPSNPSCSREMSLESSSQLLAATPPTSSEESPWQQIMSTSSGLDVVSSSLSVDGSTAAGGGGEGVEEETSTAAGGGGEGVGEVTGTAGEGVGEVTGMAGEGVGEVTGRHLLRSQSLQLAAPPPISMATILDHDSDDVIAVPVRSSSVMSDLTNSEAGGKSRSKRRSRRSKKSSTSSLLPSLPATQSEDVTKESLNLIPEDIILPFPDAGLPEASQVSSEAVPQRESADSASTPQRGTGFVSKMRELARQGGQNIVQEADALQEAINQPVKKVKELLSSLATPSPTAAALQPQTMFINERCSVSEPLMAEDALLTSGLDQSDCGLVSPDSPSPPAVEQEFAATTANTLRSLALPNVYCSSHALRTLISNWMVVMETNMSIGVEEATIVDLLTLALEVGEYGCERDLVPFLSHYGSLLNGPRTMAVLGSQVWSVRCEGWRVLVRSGGEGENDGEPAGTVKKLTNESARAPDLPTYLTWMATSDPSSLVNMCVESWPSVQLWEVAIVCSTDQSDCSVESHDSGCYTKPNLDVYARCLTQLLGSSEDVREDVRCDEELVLASLEMVLKTCPPPSQELADDTGQPRAWSHKSCWSHSSLLATLVDMCVTMTAANITLAITLCERHRYWLGVVQLAAVRGDRGKSLRVLLSLRDISLLQESQKWGNLLITVSDWQEALHIMNDLTGHVTDHVTGCEGELTMSELVYKLVSSVGPALATRILNSVGGAEGGATGEEGVKLHSLMVQLAAIHSEQRSVARSLLETIDRYLWSRQPVALSPQLQVLEEREREGRRRGIQLELAPSQTDMEWRPTLEDSGRHWGVRVRGVCGVCLSPLSTVVSPQLPGLLVFHCGHAYHRHCVPELSCHECFERNFAEHYKATS